MANAQHSTFTEHKVTFEFNGKKYGFRCDEGTLDALAVEQGSKIPTLDLWTNPDALKK